MSAGSDGTEGDDGGGSPSISADGRFVAFESFATNLVPGDTNGSMDVFVRDRQAGTTELISPNGAGTVVDHWSNSPSISADGRYLAFETRANGIPGGSCLAVQDRQTGYTRWLMGAAGEPFSISADGRCVALKAWADYLAPGNDHQVFGIFVVVDPLGPPTYVSLRGTDRYDTAIKVSKASFPGALPAGSGLVLAPGETFQEALCGAPLAVACGGPVLLTTRSGLDSRVKAEILRLKPEYVICVGLSDAIKNAVQAALGGTGTARRDQRLERIRHELQGGESPGGEAGRPQHRCRHHHPGGPLSRRSRSVSPAPAFGGGPSLLTGPGTVLSTHATRALNELGITRALKVGTYAALPAAVTGVGNLSGGDRYQTNRNVAEWAKNNAGLSFTHLAIATGEKFPDALAAGPYLASERGTLLLSPLYGPLPAVIAAEITANAAATWHVSYIAMIEPVIGQVKALLPGASPALSHWGPTWPSPSRSFRQTTPGTPTSRATRSTRCPASSSPASGAAGHLHPDFGTVWDGAPNGIPYCGRVGQPATGAGHLRIR